MRAALLALALLVAGCSQPAPQVPDPLPAKPAPPIFQESIDHSVAIESPAGCIPPLCVPPGRSQLFRAPGNMSIVGLRLTVANEPFTDGVDWSLYCGGDKLGCRKPLAEGSGALPVTIELGGLRLAPGSSLEIEVRAAAAGPVADDALGLARGRTQVTGTIDLQDVPGTNWTKPLLVPVSVEGVSGPCEFVSEGDCGGLSGSLFSYPDLPGKLVGGDLVMTWTPTGELDRELVLQVGCSSCRLPFPRQVSAVGPSPLHLRTVGLDMDRPNVPAIQVQHRDPTGTRETWEGGTRTPVHIEGVLFVRPDPPPSVPPVPFPVSLDGHSGPCTFVPPDCGGIPGGSSFYYEDLNGTVVGATLVMTWTARSELDRELGLRLTDDCGGCAGDAEVFGPSPLTLNATRLQLPNAAIIQVFSNLRAGDFSMPTYTGTRTPVHIEGWLLVEPGRFT